MGRAFEYRKAAKMKRWGNMSKVFPKYSKLITMAAKDGVPDPDQNAKLRTIIQNAKAENVPKDVIDNAIKRASGKDAADIKEIRYEAKGPYGVQLVIECATDNHTRTVANVKAILVRNKAEMLTSGALDFMFTRKAVFVFDKKDNIDIEELELELIDFGLEEIEEDVEAQENGDDKAIIRIYGDFTSFGDLSKALEDQGIEVSKSTLEFIPNTPIEITEEQMNDVEILIEKLEDDEDVQVVYTNLA
ncbi:MAG: YebC/PmpR family DNA-binding transcriptional regulator [Sulfurovaceae bacterium]|nr:YebC/PmpR family DNA-binding transcriptional regulator [Sulfurovaceae bacterium]